MKIIRGECFLERWLSRTRTIYSRLYPGITKPVNHNYVTSFERLENLVRWLMHQLIVSVRHLRRIALFKISARTMVLFLLMLGLWVATRDLELSLDDVINDKIIHFVVFFGLSMIMDLAIERHPFWLWKGLPLLIYGILVEVLQYFSPDRSFSLLDMLADFSGIAAYYVLKTTLIYFDKRS